MSHFTSSDVFQDIPMFSKMHIIYDKVKGLMNHWPVSNTPIKMTSFPPPREQGQVLMQDGPLSWRSLTGCYRLR